MPAITLDSKSIQKCVKEQTWTDGPASHIERMGSGPPYTLTSPAGQLPPANAFWSVTMYDGKTPLLIDNPINRYLVNGLTLPDLKKNADGSFTPDGPIYVVMRIYWPKETALNGSWKPPAVQLTK